MALRIGFKIHHYLGQNQLKSLLNEHTRASSSKPKYVIHPVRRLKSSSHTTLVPRKYATAKPITVAYRDRDLQVSEYEMDAFENDLQPSAMPEYFTSTLESNLANFPEKSDRVRGRFAKSSTQSALSVPLKMPRLANPFPERLKSFPSDTMADDEKAQLMADEMKMVARYNLQKSQQADHLEPPAALQYHEDAVECRESTDLQVQPPQVAAEDEPVPSRRPQARSRRYRKGSLHQQQRRFSSESALSDLEQCDVILDRLRAQYPEYRALKKPLFVPGSAEEREFIDNTLRCIAKHKPAVVKRAIAPFPSYSEVKTFVREPRELTRRYSTVSSTRASSETRLDGLRDLVAQAQLWETPKSDRETLSDEENAVRSAARTPRPSSGSRSFSTRPNMCKKEKKKAEPTCKTMKSPGCADPNPNKCEYVYEKSTCKKLAAPYPSYSECMGDQYEEEPSECKICPWKIPSRHERKTSSDDGKKKYSTFAPASAADASHRKKPACKNPFADKKPCDFERAAQKQDEKRQRRPHQPSPKPQPPSKKSFSTLTSKHSYHTFSKSRLHAKIGSVSSRFSTQTLADNKTIVDRIRRWLNSWRPGSENIRITQSTDLCAGRETYIIEIQDVVAEQRSETAPWISSESLRPATVHHVARTGPEAGYACAESSGKKPGKAGTGCPPPKKKETVTEDKKKCRQRKKRKLPSCHDVGKDKAKKDALNYSASQVNDQPEIGDPLSQETHEISALQEPKVPGQFENVPFKLKPQFWRV